VIADRLALAMPATPSEEYLQPYRRALKRHGVSFESTLWRSREGQLLRFDIMIDLAGFEDCIVTDVGCGRGDFAARLLERRIPFRHFIGIDALPEMIRAAKARGLARSDFHLHDVLADPKALVTAAPDGSPPDYLCFSGTLNTMDENIARRLVKMAFLAARQGVLFNYLSDRHHRRFADDNLDPARRFDTLAWLDWAMDLSSRVSFTQDYLDGHDATILIHHDDAD